MLPRELAIPGSWLTLSALSPGLRAIMEQGPGSSATGSTPHGVTCAAWRVPAGDHDRVAIFLCAHPGFAAGPGAVDLTELLPFGVEPPDITWQPNPWARSFPVEALMAVARMGKSEKKARRKEWERAHELATAWDWARTVPRPVGESPRIPGIGARLLELRYDPALWHFSSWDLIDQGDRLTVYCSWQAYEAHYRCLTSDEYMQVGYEPLEFTTEELQHYVDSLSRLTIPVLIWQPRWDEEVERVKDGVGYELNLFGEFGSMSLRWSSQSPPEWRPLLDLAEEMIERFRAVSPAPSPVTLPESDYRV